MVSFTVMGNGDIVELMTESNHNAYIIRVSKYSPTITRLHNLAPVEQFPKSNLARKLEDCYKSVALDIEKLFRLALDSVEYRAAWWEVKCKTERA